jgi:hypothetical protein
MVQAGMTHQAVADHFNVSRITISRILIRLRQTGRRNDRSRSGRPPVMSQRQDRHLRLIHLRNRMITAEDTARRTTGLENVLISDQTVRRRLRESGPRARRLVVGTILKQRNRTARLAWARARRRWRFHTWQHVLFSDESRFSLRLSDWRYRVYRMRGEHFTDKCERVRPFWRRKCYGLGLNLSWWSHSAHNCSRNIECRQIQGRYSWSYRTLSATAKRWWHLSTWQCKMSRGTCLARLSVPESHPCSSLAGIITGSVTNRTFMGWTR